METLDAQHEIDQVEIALARAALYSALALGFRRPTEETLRRLTTEESIGALVDAAALLDPVLLKNHPFILREPQDERRSGRNYCSFSVHAELSRSILRGSHQNLDPHPDPPPFGARESALSSEESLRARSDLGLTATVKNLAQAQPALVWELQSSFDRLFGHTARGAVPPYETEYGTEALFQQSQEMGDLMGFYGAFGLTLNAREHERPDHISCECEFLSFLALKEAYAVEHGATTIVEETRRATRLFLRDHLGRFAPAFTTELKHQSSRDFYGALADFCDRLVTSDCARFGVPHGPRSLSLRPATDDRVPMACGSGAQCMAIPGASAPEE